jgi:hypothetical protein
MVQSTTPATAGNSTGATAPSTRTAALLQAASDAALFDELRRRGYNGRLRYTKIVTV